jgi:hypothetical protein
MRGGLDSIRSNEAVTRTVVWADLLHAASHGTRPMTVDSKFNAEDDGLAQFLVNGDMATGTAGSQGHRSPVPSSLVPVFDMLRLLCVARSSPDIFDTEYVSKRKAFSNLLSRVEYLLVDDYATVSTQLPRDQEIEVNSDFGERIDAVCEATVAGALIFSYWDLRDLPISAQPFEAFARRLRASLQKLLHKRNPSTCVPPALLLWLHFQGFKATSVDSRISDHWWFVDHATDICRALEIDTEIQLEAMIREVMVVSVYLQESSDLFISAFWRAIRDHEHRKKGSELAWH